jgi:hypothetical protein
MNKTEIFGTELDEVNGGVGLEARVRVLSVTTFPSVDEVNGGVGGEAMSLDGFLRQGSTPIEVISPIPNPRPICRPIPCPRPFPIDIDIIRVKAESVSAAV